MHQEKARKDAKTKSIKMMEASALVKGKSFLVKYLKTMEMFNFLNLHHLLAMERWTPKTWRARLERSMDS